MKGVRKVYQDKSKLEYPIFVDENGIFYYSLNEGVNLEQITYQKTDISGMTDEELFIQFLKNLNVKSYGNGSILTEKMVKVLLELDYDNWKYVLQIGQIGGNKEIFHEIFPEMKNNKIEIDNNNDLLKAIEDLYDHEIAFCLYYDDIDLSYIWEKTLHDEIEKYNIQNRTRIFKIGKRKLLENLYNELDGEIRKESSNYYCLKRSIELIANIDFTFLKDCLYLKE